MESAPGPETVINGKRVLYFGGTGYFALHGHPEVIEAGVAAFRKYGIHSATSRTGFGNTPVQIELERRIAEFFGTEDSIHFVSGYLDNLFLVQALKGRVGAIFIDETSHFSIRDAVYSALKPVHAFKHRDPEDLSRQLKAKLKAGEVPLVMSDGIFPTFGVIAPVPDYLKAIEPYGGYLCLDDSHAVGHLGPNGRGTYDYYGVKNDRCFYAGTMSKAFGGHGGFIPANKAFIDHIKATCGAYPGATPSPTPAMAASMAGLAVARREPERRERLRRNVARMKGGMKKLGFEMNDTPVPDRHLDPEVRRGHEEGPGGPLRPGHRRGAPEICRRPGRGRPARLDLLRAHDGADRPAPLRAQASRLRSSAGRVRGSGATPGRTLPLRRKRVT